MEIKLNKLNSLYIFFLALSTIFISREKEINLLLDIVLAVLSVQSFT